MADVASVANFVRLDKLIEVIFILKLIFVAVHRVLNESIANCRCDWLINKVVVNCRMANWQTERIMTIINK